MVKIADHSAVIYGTHFPNRLFVGCLPAKATAQDLADFFSNFGPISEAKVVLDENGMSRRFGFVSFGNQDGVNAVLKQGSIFFLGKKINVGPAVKKKHFDDVKGKPATLILDENISKTQTQNKPHVIYRPMDTCLAATDPQMAPYSTVIGCPVFPSTYPPDHSISYQNSPIPQAHLYPFIVPPFQNNNNQWNHVPLANMNNNQFPMDHFFYSPPHRYYVNPTQLQSVQHQMAATSKNSPILTPNSSDKQINDTKMRDSLHYEEKNQNCIYQELGMMRKTLTLFNAK